MAVVHFEGAEYNFDIQDLTLMQARIIKNQTGMSVRKLMDGLVELDPEALAALYWLMLNQNGKAVDIHKVNFKVMEFGKALDEAFTDDEEDEANPTQQALDAPATQ